MRPTFVLWLCLLACSSHVLSVPTVKLNNGQLFGTQHPEAQIFFSVPYAKPPLGELRFQDPVAIGYHGDIDVSNNTGVGCIGINLMCSIGQCSAFQSEDCLYLNVYVPNTIDLSNSDNPPTADRPVVIWFHGGAFWFGSGLSPIYDGRYMAESIDAIVVTLNYRYLPFGFLAMGSSAPGNMGLRDQRMVMQWVQDNIARFGGNPQRVTIWGESAGAQSVGLHLMSSISAPLFNQGVMESNPVAFTFKSIEEAREQATTLARRAGCLSGSYNCLVQKSSEEIKKAFVKVMVGNMVSGDFYGFLEPFAPVIDGIEFTQQQADAYAAGKWSTNKNFIIGTNQQELYLVSGMIPFPLSYDVFTGMCQKMWPGIADDVINLYAPDPTVSDFRDAYGDMLTHYAFTCASRSVARSAARTKKDAANIFYYTNYHPLTGPDCPTLLGPLKSLCGYSYHSAELSYFWRSGPSVGQTYMTDEIPYVNAWSSYFGNFVYSGDTNQGLADDFQSSLGSFEQWPTYEAPQDETEAPGPDDWVSSALDAPNSSTEQEPIDQYCTFWDGVGYDFKIFGRRMIEVLNEVLRQP